MCKMMMDPAYIDRLAQAPSGEFRVCFPPPESHIPFSHVTRPKEIRPASC